MKFIYIFLLTSILGFHHSSLAHEANSLIIVMHSKGPNWPTNREVPFDDPEILKHAEYWASQSKLDQGGPFEGTFEDVMLLKPGIEIEEAKNISAGDPAVKSGLLKADIRRWLLFIDNTNTSAKKKSLFISK